MTINAVAPYDPSTSSLHQHVIRSRVARVSKFLQHLWGRTKISQLGQYSARREEDLNAYCCRTPLLRVILVVVLTPWPALLIQLVAESIPLQDPADGWKANYGAWSRLWIAIASGSAGSLFQIRATTPELSNWKIVGITIATACGSTTIAISVASLWVFPIPFYIFITGCLGVTLFVILFVVAIKEEGSNICPAIEDPLRQKLYLIIAQVPIVAAYTIYSVIFTKCTPHQRVGLLVLLPSMKIGLKHMIARLASDNEESIPAVVVFTVDVFNGLYTSICMQSSGTWWASFFMISLNAGDMALSLWEINRAAKLFAERDGKSDTSSRRSQVSYSVAPTTDACSRSWSFQRSTKSLPGTGSADQLNCNSRNAADSDSGKLTTVANKLQVSSKLLFYLEYRALVGYIEAVIPLMYAVYLAILVNLPSAKYYPHSRSLTSQQLQTTIVSILAYASTEILSLIWLHVVTKRKSGFSLLYQLAFVLENETELLQGRLLVWIVTLLQLPLVHFGASDLRG